MRLALAFFAGLIIACHSTPPSPQVTLVLSPGELDFKVPIGTNQEQVLSFTVNGAPLTQATFSLQQDDGLFTVVPQPLGATPHLRFTPRDENVVQNTLFVRTSTGQGEVLVRGIGFKEAPVPPPECDPPQFPMCHQLVGNCTFQPAHDGRSCGTMCGRAQVCQTGECVDAPDAGGLPSCAVATDITPLTPTWTFDKTGDELQLGAVDADGNLLLRDTRVDLDHTLSDERLILLGSDGSPRWEHLIPLAKGATKLGGIIMVAGPRVLTSAESQAPAVKARSMTDGSVIWSFSESPVAGMVMADDQTVAIALTDLPRVVFLDVATGMEKSRQVLPIVPMSLFSDGQGTVYVSGATNFDNDIAAVSQSGVLWTTPSTLPIAFSGTQFLLMDGAVFSAADGRRRWNAPNDVANGQLDTSVIRPDGVALTQRVLRNCKSQLLTVLDMAHGTKLADCVMDKAGLVLGQWLAAGGTVATFTQDQLGRFQVTTYDDQLQPVNAYLFQQPADSFFSADDSLFAGGRWFMTLLGTDGHVSRVQAFDLPNETVAAHGWVGPGGNPTRDGRPW